MSTVAQYGERLACAARVFPARRHHALVRHSLVGGAFGATLPGMGSTAESLLQQALTLPEEDRAEIATRLIASLDADSRESRQDVEEAWAAEIERRCEALDAGATTTRSWTEVRRRIETDLLRK